MYTNEQAIILVLLFWLITSLLIFPPAFLTKEKKRKEKIEKLAEVFSRWKKRMPFRGVKWKTLYEMDEVLLAYPNK